MIGGLDTSGGLFGASWYASAWRVERYYCLLYLPEADREYWSDRSIWSKFSTWLVTYIDPVGQLAASMD